jgi:hypothetical protein
MMLREVARVSNNTWIARFDIANCIAICPEGGECLPVWLELQSVRIRLGSGIDISSKGAVEALSLFISWL